MEKKKKLKGLKKNLPIKSCQKCHKPMQWRKKWADNWDSVKYCSQRCRSQKAQ